MVKKIQCRVIRSVPLTQKTSEHGQSERANRPSASTRTVREQNVQLKPPYEHSVDDNTAHSNDKVRSDNDQFLGWHKFAEEATQGQLLDVWA